MRKSSSYAKKKSVKRSTKGMRKTTSTKRSSKKLRKTNAKGGTIGVIANNAAVNDLVVGGIGALLGYGAGNLVGTNTNPITSVVTLAKNALGGLTGKDPVVAAAAPDLNSKVPAVAMPITATVALTADMVQKMDNAALATDFHDVSQLTPAQNDWARENYASIM